MAKRRAMSSAHASEVKTAGHRNEVDFATLIGGQVQQGSHTDKKDVIDRQHRSHSVKAGTWWQIFLYGRERLRTDAIFQGLGQVADIMIDCLDAFPLDRADYLRDKVSAKQRLQPEMQRLLAEMQVPKIFKAFLDKALFDGGNADYLSIFLGPAKTQAASKHFHIFHKDDVVDALATDVTLQNSKARKTGEMDAQKVTFGSGILGRNIGEIEVRTDSDIHYREMKFRVNAESVMHILTSEIGESSALHPQLTTYGRAVRLFRLPQQQSLQQSV